MEKRAYIVKSGEFTQYDDEGQAHVFRVGDTIELSEEDAAAQGADNFAPVVSAPVRFDDED